jgi:hypothetical protein
MAPRDFPEQKDDRDGDNEASRLEAAMPGLININDDDNVPELLSELDTDVSDSDFEHAPPLIAEVQAQALELQDAHAIEIDPLAMHMPVAPHLVALVQLLGYPTYTRVINAVGVARLSDPNFVELLNLMTQSLGPSEFVTFMVGSSAARLGDDGFMSRVDDMFDI